MATTTTRQRSRSSVDHIFDLVGDLDEDQLSNFLHELNSSGEANVAVSQGVEYFEEQRRSRGPTKALRPTPSFLNQPHEPVDWPKQNPRAVSGSQWRQSMRVASSPYGNGGGIACHQTEPISPPLTASPPLSPPLSPSRRNNKNNSYKNRHESPVSPRRSVTAPLTSSMEKSSRALQIESVPQLGLGRPISPPRDDEVVGGPGPQLASFSFSLDGAQRQQQSDFSRISTMPLMGGGNLSHDTLPDRPRTSTGDAATTANTFKPRSFRRISRPMFLSPANIPAPDALAQKLSQYLFDDASPPSFQSMTSPMGGGRPAVQEEEQDVPFSLEAMLKEPVTPRANKMVYGHVEKEVPSVGIFEVLSEG